jgi:hypothetical protein
MTGPEILKKKKQSLAHTEIRDPDLPNRIP